MSLFTTNSVFGEPTDNQDCSDDWKEDEEKLPGHENLTEKDVELFRHIQELALQVRRKRKKKLWRDKERAGEKEICTSVAITTLFFGH